MHRKTLLIAIISTGCFGPGQGEIDSETKEAPRIEYTGTVDLETNRPLVFYEPAGDKECLIDYFTRTYGPYEIPGRPVPIFVTKRGDRFEEVDMDAEHIHVTGATARSTGSPFSNFIGWGEAYANGNLIAWMDHVPYDEYEIEPNFDGSVDLARTDKIFFEGTVRARYPSVDTTVSFDIEFVKYHSCDKN